MNESGDSKDNTVTMADAISRLDLDRVRLRLNGKPEGHGWTPRHAAPDEPEYRRFFVLLAGYPDQAFDLPTEAN